MPRFWSSLPLGCFLVVQSVAAQAGWSEAKSDHFIIYSEQKPAELSAYASRLERYDQAVRVARKMDDPPLSDSTKLTVYVLRGQDDIQDLAGPGVAGFYIPSASGSVAYVSTEKSSGKGDLSPQTVFMHEYLHHLMLMGQPAPYPMWMSEGYAEFFATARFEQDGAVTFGIAPDHRGRLLRLLQSQSLRRMLDGAQRHVTAEEYLANYSRGWLLTHYLAFEPSRRGQVSRYLQGIESGKDGVVAAEEAFGNLRQLDRDLDAYLGRKVLPVQTIPSSSISVGQVQMRPLAPAEEATLKIWIKLNSGLDRDRARFLAGGARNVVAKYPNSPEALTALAATQVAAKRFGEAVGTATLAADAAPRSIKALTYKARAMLGQAKENPAQADWTRIRSAIAAANRLDPDAPEPLLLFYESFAAQKTRPPANAVMGLLYALELAPYDSDVRYTAVRELLAQNRLREAKAAFRQLAYNPHDSKEHDRNLDIMDKIIAGDAAAAIAMLDEDQRKREKRE
jgi:tetratricopeptide (TPR) repeat protein